MADLPPGVSDRDLPGERPEDVAWAKLLDDIKQSGLTAEEARHRWEFQPKFVEAKERLNIERAAILIPRGPKCVCLPEHANLECPRCFPRR